MWRRTFTRSIACLSLVGLLAAACSDDSGKKATATSAATAASGAGASSASAPPTTAAGPKSLLADRGPCDTSKPQIKVGSINVVDSAVLSLADNVDGLVASVSAFNKRGGIGGHCMSLTTCDSKGDPNREADCARRMVSDGAVASLSDNASFNAAAVANILKAAGIPRIGSSPDAGDLNGDLIYPFDAGGVGTTFMMVPACVAQGQKKIAAIHVDSPQIGPLFDALSGMLKAYGAELVAKIAVPAGTTDYQQFVLAAQNAGATCAIIPLGESEALQVLRASQELGSKLLFSGSVLSFSRNSLKKLGPVGERMIMNNGIAPIDPVRWPIYNDVIRDFEASGKSNLNRDTVKQSAPLGWFTVYAFQQIIEKFGNPDNVTRESVVAATKAAKDIDMFGAIPNWTPSKSNPPFKAVSNPWYYIITFKDGQFVVSDKQYNVLNELVGKIDYNHDPTQTVQPASPTTTP